MNNNLYGGITYPNSSFIFDAFYSNYTNALAGAANDGVLIGRYVLVKYSNAVLT
jgi:hypothetical protein